MPTDWAQQPSMTHLQNSTDPHKLNEAGPEQAFPPRPRSSRGHQFSTPTMRNTTNRAHSRMDIVRGPGTLRPSGTFRVPSVALQRCLLPSLEDAATRDSKTSPINDIPAGAPHPCRRTHTRSVWKVSKSPVDGTATTPVTSASEKSHP